MISVGHNYYLTPRGTRILVKALAQTDIGRKYLRRQLISAIKDCKSPCAILFICKGNICRSPFAEAFSRGYLPSTVRCTSAGYLPVAGRPAHSVAVECATEFGVDLQQHRSVILTSRMIEESSIVLTFDFDNLEHILKDTRNLKRPICLLGSIISDQKIPVEIPDPNAYEIEGFRAVYGVIVSAIQELHSVLSCS
jgi:protein-tyrosine-phosphatase